MEKTLSAALLGLLALVQVSRAGSVFEFGRDVGGSKVVLTDYGKIYIWQKNVHVPLTIPDCMNVELVRVEVFNSISNPAVTFDSHSNTVLISYKLWQYSGSTYEVVVKATPSGICDDSLENSTEDKDKDPDTDTDEDKDDSREADKDESKDEDKDKDKDDDKNDGEDTDEDDNQTQYSDTQTVARKKLRKRVRVLRDRYRRHPPT